MKEILNLQYDNYEKTLVDIYLPETENFHTVVFFHGGGLEHGIRRNEIIVEVATALTKAGYAFASVGYRLYPYAKFPDYLLDSAKATAFVKKYVQDCGGNGEIIISGQSAGAWLSLMLCLNREYLANEGVETEEIKGWFIDSAQTTSHFNVLQQEKGVHKLTQRIDEYAPLYFLNENTRFSRMMLVLYDQDMACRYEQNMLFYKAVLAFNPEADIEYRLINGTHCSSTKQWNKKGETLFVETFLNWAKKN
jgi:hypothetical protein